MSLEWLAETIVAAVVTFVIWGAMGWLWAKRKLLPLLRRHAPMLAAMFEKGRER